MNHQRLTIFSIIIVLTLVFVGCMGFKPYTPPERPNQPDTETSRLQNMLDQAVNEFGLPGVQAGILRPGQQPVLAASGTEDFERRQAPIDNHKAFRIGSTTKMFVAALICRLAEQKKLKLDDTLDLWFPDFPQAATIRVRDLLNQTSGIQESLFTDTGMMMESVLDPHKRWQPAAVMATLAKSAHPQPAGTRHFVYANNNYLLLGLIAEEAGNAPLASQLEREFFEPLGMRDTCLLPWSERLPNGPVPGYDEYIPFGPHLIAADQTSWDSLTFSAGAMASSAHDLLVWLDALFHGRVVSAASLDLMRGYVDARDNGRDEGITGYGLGLARYDIAGTLMEGHPGGGFGGECFPFWDPANDTSYVVVYNLSRQDNPAGKALLGRMLFETN